MATLNQFQKFICSVDNEDITKQGMVMSDDNGKGVLCVKHYHLSGCKEKEEYCKQWHE